MLVTRNSIKNSHSYKTTATKSTRPFIDSFLMNIKKEVNCAAGCSPHFVGVTEVEIKQRVITKSLVSGTNTVSGLDVACYDSSSLSISNSTSYKRMLSESSNSINNCGC